MNSLETIHYRIFFQVKILIPLFLARARGSLLPTTMHKLLAFSIHDKYLLPILYLIVFLAFCGSNIGGAPRTQMYEKIICQNQYGNITLGDNKDSICKSREVQEELAFLKGADRMLGVVPSKYSLKSTMQI